MKNHLFFVASLATALFSACSNNEVEQLTSNEGSIVSFAINRNVARATTDANTGTTTLAVDETIGISSTGLTTDLKGTSFTIKDAVGNLEATDGSSFTYNRKNPASFYAYYPSTASATENTSVSFTVKADQSDETKYHNSDFMTAEVRDMEPVPTTVNLSFAHQLTLIKVVLTNFKNDTEVVMKGITPNVSWTLGNEIVTGDAASVDITMWRRSISDTSIEYWAVVPAQTLKKDQVLFAIKADKNYTYTPSSDITLEKGKQTKFTLNYTPEINSVALSAALTSTWGETTELGPFDVEGTSIITPLTGIVPKSTGRQSMDPETWAYTINVGAAGTVTFDASTSSFTMKFTKLGNNFDYKSVFYYGKNNPITTGHRYKLTFTMSSTTANAGIRLGMNQYKGSYFFCIEEGNTYYTEKLLTCSDTPGTEQSYSVIYNCKYKNSEKKHTPVTPTVIDGNEDLEFHLFFYPDNVNEAITMKNFKLVPID